MQVPLGALARRLELPTDSRPLWRNALSENQYDTVAATGVSPDTLTAMTLSSYDGTALRLDPESNRLNAVSARRIDVVALLPRVSERITGSMANNMATGMVVCLRKAQPSSSRRVRRGPRRLPPGTVLPCGRSGCRTNAIPTSAAWVISSTGTWSLPAAIKACAARMSAARARIMRRSGRLPATGCASVMRRFLQADDGAVTVAVTDSDEAELLRVAGLARAPGRNRFKTLGVFAGHRRGRAHDAGVAAGDVVTDAPLMCEGQTRGGQHVAGHGRLGVW
jgi:hypothetical protein